MMETSSPMMMQWHCLGDRWNAKEINEGEFMEQFVGALLNSLVASTNAASLIMVDTKVFVKRYSL